MGNIQMKPVFRHDLFKKFFTKLGEIPYEWYEGMDIETVVKDILGEKEGAEYLSQCWCVHCLDPVGMCDGCPIDWGKDTYNTRNPCISPASPLTKYIKESEKLGAIMLRPMSNLQMLKLKKMATDIANLPLSPYASRFNVVE